MWILYVLVIDASNYASTQVLEFCTETDALAAAEKIKAVAPQVTRTSVFPKEAPSA